MSRPIKAKINVSKILKEYLFEGKSGKMLDLTIWPNRDGAGKYGDTHYIVQDLGKEAREKGIKGDIIGNMTIEAAGNGGQSSARPAQQRPAAKPASKPESNDWDDDSSVPF